MNLDSLETNLPPRTHNNPPSDVEYLSENLTLRHITLIRQAEEHVAFAANFPQQFTEQNEADFTADYIKRVQVCQKEIEKTRKEEKEPFLRQGQFVDGFFNELQNKLQPAIEKANKPLREYLERKAYEEKQRRDEEAAAMRKEQEAAMREAAASQDMEAIEHAVTMTTVAKVADQIAAAPVTGMASAGGKYSKAGLKEKWSAVITDIEQLDLHKLRPYISSSELQKALERFVKAGGRQCDGAEIKKYIDVGVK